MDAQPENSTEFVQSMEQRKAESRRLGVSSAVNTDARVKDVSVGDDLITLGF
jgi:hypothetical protein